MNILAWNKSKWYPWLYEYMNIGQDNVVSLVYEYMSMKQVIEVPLVL